MSIFKGIREGLTDLYQGVTGKTQADAAKEAGKLQASAATNAAQLAADATAQQRADLQPFTQFGASFIDPAQQAVTQSQTLFGEGAPDAIMNNPMFQALLEQANTNILQNQAVAGRLGTGETPQFMLDAALRTGFDVLNQERNANLANVSMFQNLVNQGQSAAAGQGAAGIQGAQIQGGFGTDAASALAAGRVGQANAQAAGMGNLVSLGTTALTGGFGSFGGGTKPTYGGGGTLQSGMGYTDPFKF